MRGVFWRIVCAGLSVVIWTAAVAADDGTVTKKIAALADFGAKIDTLEQAVDDITVTGALALLKHEYPEWEFTRSSGFDGAKTGASNDLGAVAAKHEYGMGKLRGAIFRNKHASDEHRDVALRILDQVKELILAGYELERLVEGDDKTMAGKFYRERILMQSDQLNTDIGDLSKEIEQAIKFSAL